MASGIETIPPEAGFPPDYGAGHFVLIGGTGSGKTYYSKYLVSRRKRALEAGGKLGADGLPPVFVFVGEISAHDWTEPEADGRALVPASHVATAWNDETQRALLENATAAGGGFVVFDDFKGAMDFHTDKRFKQMVRALRHLAVQIAAIAHTPNDVPPVVKDNVTHALLFFTSNLAAVRELAQVYLAGDVAAVRAAMGALPPHAVFKVNTRQNTRAIHAAPGPEESGVGTSGVGLGVAVGGASLGGLEARGRNVCVSGGTYNDASRNTQYLQLNQNIEAQIAQNQVTYADIRTRAAINREIEEERVMHKARLSALEEREELKGLLLSPWLSGEGRDRAALLLARATGNPGVTPYNLFTDGVDEGFMAAYYPQTPYERRDAARAAVATYAPLAVAAATRDRGALVGEGFKAFAPTLARGLKLLRGGSSSPPRTAAQAARAREAARRLIVFRPGREKGWQALRDDPRALRELVAALRPALKNPAEAREDTAVPLSLELLRRHFPADFADERRFAKARGLAGA